MGASPQAEAVEGAIAFSTPYFAAPSPRAPPLLGETELSPKSSRVEQPSPSRGRTLGERRSRDWGPPDHSQDSRDRQNNRPGEVQAAWWASSEEEVSLQLVGGRPRTSISLGEDSSLDTSRKSSTPDRQLVDARNDPTPATLRQPFTLADDDFAPTDQAISLFNIGTFAKPPKKSSSTDSSTKSSLVSAASSFAHQLCRRTNMRLLRKRCKPLQHTTKKQRVSEVKATPPLRSPTYGVPKVVEDSRDDDPLGQSATYDSLQAYLDKSTKVAVTSLKLPPPKRPRTKTSSHASAERRTDSPSTKRTDSPSTKRSTSPTLRQPKSSKMQRPGILRSSASLDIAEATKLNQYHQRGGGRHKAGATTLSRTSSRESANYNKQQPNPLVRHHSGKSQSQKTQHSSSSRGRPSPPNLDPLPGTPRSWATAKSETNPFQTDDSYFSSMRSKMSSRQGFTPTLSPAEPERPFMRRAVEIPQIPENQQQQKRHQEIWSSASSDAMQKRQKRGSIFGAFGLQAPTTKLAAGLSPTPASTSSLQEKVGDAATSPGGQCSSAGSGNWSPAWPKVSTAAVMDPVKVTWRRMSEDMTLPLPLTLPPYFARNRKRQGDSDPPQTSETLSLASPMSPTTTGTNASGSKDSELWSAALQKRRASNFEMGPVSPFTPLPPLREDYDRTRRVSIEIPGTPGVHHRPDDTPHSSPATVISETSKITMLRRPLQSMRLSPSYKSLSMRKSSLRPTSTAATATTTLSPPASQTTPSSPPAAAAASAEASPRKRSSISRDITAEPNGAAPKEQTLLAALTRPLQNRRSALTPIARQATLASVATNKPLQRPLSHLRKPQRSKSILLADRNNIKE
jgi:hypothetical protein